MSGTNDEYTQTTDGKEITKQSKSNFLYSFSLLPKEKSEAIKTVYAFCRKTDDIVDDDNDNDTEEAKYSKLTEWKEELEKALLKGDSKNSLLNSLSITAKKYKIPSESFFDLISGMEMDLRKKRYYKFDELLEYCFNVASSVGLMSIEIFGYNNKKTKEFAINLGIAMQLTNILRDIKTDAEKGRIYIPLEDLRRFNYSEKDLLESKYNIEFINLMEYQCERVKFFYNEANKNLSDEDKGLMFPARIMEHIYFRLLQKIEMSNHNVFEKRITVSKLKKIYITAGVYLKYRLLYGMNEK